MQLLHMNKSKKAKNLLTLKNAKRLKKCSNITNEPCYTK